MAVEKPAVSRRLALVGGGVLIVVMVVGATVSFIFSNPQQRKEAEAEADALAAVEGQKPSEVSELEQALEERERELERLRRQAELDERRGEIRAGTSLATNPRGDRPANRDLPEFDPDLLAALEEADRQAGQRPRLTGGSNRQLNEGGVSAAGQPGAVATSSAPAPAGMYEAYSDGLELRIEAKEEDFTRDRPQRAPEREAAESEFFETKVPTLPPSSRIIAQGSQIRAVLLSRIDTRNPGNVIAQVTADHYDSIRAETLLIPKGSRLIGAYANSVSPGNTQLAIAFSRLMLPDGRAIDLGGMPATGNDGIVGIQGDYNGNFWRAVGPAILTTLVGSAIDEATRPEEGEGTASTGFGGTVQSPTVAQQSIPKITDAVLERYRGAQPYITAEPGQALKILVTADLEIPVLETSRR